MPDVNASDGEGNTSRLKDVPPTSRRPPRVFISYAHDDDEHKQAVVDFWMFLRSIGIDAQLDEPDSDRPRDWAIWMGQQIREADHVLLIASPAYKRRAEGRELPAAGRGAQWEAQLIRDAFYADQARGATRFLSVLLPGRTVDDVPDWMGPASRTQYQVHDLSVSGSLDLVRYITGQARRIPELGTPPVLDTTFGRQGAFSVHSPEPVQGSADEPDHADIAASDTANMGLRTRVDIEVSLDDKNYLTATTKVEDTLLGCVASPLPASVKNAWAALTEPPAVAAKRLDVIGESLAGLLFDEATTQAISRILNRLLPENGIDFVVHGDAATQALPIELLRMPNAGTSSSRPSAELEARDAWRAVALSPGVTIRRQLVGAPRPAPLKLAGPVKVIAAVAAPEETRTASAPLDVEAEMQAIQDATTLSVGGTGQLRILEVADLPSIVAAVGGTTGDSFHVLHLSAHGGRGSIELEDEDGNPVSVTARQLVDALRAAGRGVPLIVLSACSTSRPGSAEGLALATGLIAGGADRVIAMQAPVSDRFATALARALYVRLVEHPDEPVAVALAAARRDADLLTSAADRPSGGESGSSADSKSNPPEWGLPLLLCAAEDAPLVDSQLVNEPLRRPTQSQGGGSVRELGVGRLIGRRSQLRTTMAVLRRMPKASDLFGARGGVVLHGIGGIGKTAIAGRAISRLRDDGWAIAIHEGRWDPNSLLNAAAAALEVAATRGSVAGAALDDTDGKSAVLLAEALRSPELDDARRLELLGEVLARRRVLIVFDDFEMNLTEGGDEFVDPVLGGVVASLARQAATSSDGGGLLMTSRYLLPQPYGRMLAPVPIPPMTRAELGRLFLRLPAVRGLTSAQQRVLVRTIGGHPRLVEFVDALLRGGIANLADVTDKLQDLAERQGLDPTATIDDLDQSLRSALIAGSADIVLDSLLGLLETAEREVLEQVAVCRIPLELVDLSRIVDARHDSAVALSGSPDDRVPRDLLAIVRRLRDLTLLLPGPSVEIHPWTAQLIGEASESPGAARQRHELASAMHMARIEEGRASYDDVIDIAIHHAALGEYDEVASLARTVFGLIEGTFARLAFVADILDVVPATERAWSLIADYGVRSMIVAGDLPTAAKQVSAIHQATLLRASADPDDVLSQRDLSVSHNRLGDLARAAGDLAEARTNYQASLDIRTRLADAEPSDPHRQRDLAVSYSIFGDLAQASGDLAEALRSHALSLAVVERLASGDPTDLNLQRDLSICHNRLGDLARGMGDLASARTSYEACLDIRTRLVESDPSNADWQRDLSIIHNRFGDLARATGDLAAARTSYQADLDIAIRLAEADPNNAMWQRDLSVSYGRFGDLSRDVGDFAAARSSYEACLDISARLASADPTNTEWQRDLAINSNRLGDFARSVGDRVTARANYVTDLEITDRLARSDTANTNWQRDLSISHSRIGDLAGDDGDLDLARSSYEASFEIVARLAAADPTNVEWQRDLAIGYGRLGDLASDAGDIEKAQENYAASLDIRTRLCASDPSNTQWQRDLAVTHGRLGDLADEAEDPGSARTYYEESVAIVARLANTDPDNAEWQRDLCICQARLGGLAREAGDFEAARAYYEAGVGIAAGLVASDPSNAGWHRDLAGCHLGLGDAARDGGDIETARLNYEAGLEISRRWSDAAADPEGWQAQVDEIATSRISGLDNAVEGTT